MKVCPPRSVECLGTFVLKDLVRLVHSDDCSSRGCDYIHIHICMYVCTPSRTMSDVQRGALAIKHACVHVCTCIRQDA